MADKIKKISLKNFEEAIKKLEDSYNKMISKKIIYKIESKIQLSD